MKLDTSRDLSVDKVITDNYVVKIIERADGLHVLVHMKKNGHEVQPLAYILGFNALHMENEASRAAKKKV